MITVAVRPSDGHVTNRINRSSIVWMFLGTNWVLSLRTFLEVTCKKGNLKYHREFSPGRWIIHVPQDVYLGVPPNGGVPCLLPCPCWGEGRQRQECRRRIHPFPGGLWADAPPRTPGAEGRVYFYWASPPISSIDYLQCTFNCTNALCGCIKFRED